MIENVFLKNRLFLVNNKKWNKFLVESYIWINKIIKAKIGESLKLKRQILFHARIDGQTTHASCIIYNIVPVLFSNNNIVQCQ